MGYMTFFGYTSTYKNTNSYSTYSSTKNTSTTTPSPSMSIFVYLVPFVVMIIIFSLIAGLGKIIDIHDDKVKAKKELLEHEAAERRKRVYKNQQAENERLYKEWCKLSEKERISKWKERREEFSHFKYSSNFREWRKEQYECQDHKCAWCKKWVLEKSEFTHVDHIMPLFNGGTNDFSNMVISCSTCNEYRKGTEIKGFNNNYVDHKNHDDNFNSVPDWIKLNKYAYPCEFSQNI